jgi:hypothetical protein
MRCYAADECAAADPPAAGALPCGWARARNAPCISPEFYSWASVAGSLALAGGTALYSAYFQGWSFRRMIFTSQALLVLVNLLDLVWVSRTNVRLGVPDWLFLLGDEVLSDVVFRLNMMPFYIFAAKLCPSSVEGSMFALFMGMSNFGTFAGGYLGSGLLHLLGGVQKPDFDNIEAYILVRSLMRALPLLLIPSLVPAGGPKDSAQKLGAGVALGAGEEPPVADDEEVGKVAGVRTIELERLVGDRDPGERASILTCSPASSSSSVSAEPTSYQRRPSQRPKGLYNFALWLH